MPKRLSAGKSAGSRSLLALSLLVVWTALPVFGFDDGQATAQETEKVIHFAVTGDTEVNLESCGCKSYPSGGLARRASVIERLKESGGYVLLLETGDFFAGVNPIDLGRSVTYLKALEAMNYAAVLVSKDDFGYGRKPLEALIKGSNLQFLAANVKDASGSDTLWNNHALVKAEGITVGIIGLSIGPDPLQASEDGLLLVDPSRVLREEVEKIKGNADLLVVITDLGPLGVKEIAGGSTEIRIWVNNGSDSLYQVLNRNSMEVFTTQLGKDLRVLNARKAPGSQDFAFSVQDIKLGESLDQDVGIRSILDSWYVEMAAKPEFQWIEPVNDPFPAKADCRYVGDDSCEKCHKREFLTMKEGVHVGTYLRLLSKQRYFLPKCFACHVTGYGKPGGFGGFDVQDPLVGVQCEACHGPAGKHVENPETEKLLKSPPDEVCLRCHDRSAIPSSVNAPEFNTVRDVYFEKIRHTK